MDMLMILVLIITLLILVILSISINIYWKTWYKIVFGLIKKGYNNSLNSCIDHTRHKMSEYFPKPTYWRANVKFELDLFNYATKTDLKKYSSSWYIIFCLKN